MAAVHNDLFVRHYHHLTTRANQRLLYQATLTANR